MNRNAHYLYLIESGLDRHIYTFMVPKRIKIVKENTRKKPINIQMPSLFF